GMNPDPGGKDPGGKDPGGKDPGGKDPGGKDGNGGGKIEKEPPVIIVERPRPIFAPSVSVGAPAPAPAAVDPPGCVYARSVRTLPGGGLQRVIVKVCPDV